MPERLSPAENNTSLVSDEELAKLRSTASLIGTISARLTARAHRAPDTQGAKRRSAPSLDESHIDSLHGAELQLYGLIARLESMGIAEKKPAPPHLVPGYDDIAGRLLRGEIPDASAEDIARVQAVIDHANDVDSK